MQAALKSSTERRDDPRFDLIFECIGTHIKNLFRKYESNGQNAGHFCSTVQNAIRELANGDEDILASLGYLDADTLLQECRNRFNPPPPPMPAAKRTPSPDLLLQTKTPPPEVASLLKTFEEKLISFINAHRDEILSKLAEGQNQAVQFLSQGTVDSDDFYDLRQKIAIRHRFSVITKLLKRLEQQKI